MFFSLKVYKQVSPRQKKTIRFITDYLQKICQVAKVLEGETEEKSVLICC